MFPRLEKERDETEYSDNLHLRVKIHNYLFRPLASFSQQAVKHWPLLCFFIHTHARLSE